MPVVDKYLATGAGIIQLPCPEMTYLGLKRWGMTRDQYDTPFYRRHCIEVLTPYMDQISEYIHNGYSIECVVGVDGSPSCGFRFTCEGYCGGVIDGPPSPFRKFLGKRILYGNCLICSMRATSPCSSMQSTKTILYDNS